MSENVLMLALSPTMEEGVIVKWVKAKGDSVAEGDVICEIETDKATMEYESSVEGVLLEIVVGEGESAAIGDTIAVIGEQGEEVEAVAETVTEAPVEQSGEPEQLVEDEESEPTVVETVSAEPVSTSVKSSPLARNVAKESGVDINEIKGSGPGGRIVEADIKAVSKDAGAAKQVAEVPVPGLSEEIIEVSAKRKLIADTLAGSKFTSPHYYLKVDVIANNLMQRRINFNAVRETKVSLNAFIIKYVAMALERHPIVNSTWQGDKILQHGRADIALAVSQADGLIAPVVRQCQAKDVVQIDTELKALIAKTRAGTLTSADYANSTFTITNLGSMGIDEFTAIINPPNSAILAIGKISKKLIVSAEDDIQIRKCMTMTLSCDHRLIDGATGAGFLSGLRDIMEGVS